LLLRHQYIFPLIAILLRVGEILFIIVRLKNGAARGRRPINRPGAGA
jgi:hypothetical protein